ETTIGSPAGKTGGDDETCKVTGGRAGKIGKPTATGKHRQTDSALKHVKRQGGQRELAAKGCGEHEDGERLHRCRNRPERHDDLASKRNQNAAEKGSHAVARIAGGAAGGRNRFI